MRILKLTPETQNDILQNLLKRSPNNYGEFEGRVNAIIEEVRKNRDQAIFSYTKQFDGADINADNILVTEAEIQEAYEQVDETLLSVIRKSLVNIKKYHEKQMQNSWFTSEDGTESNCTGNGRCICTWWKSSISILCTYECIAGKSCGC